MPLICLILGVILLALDKILDKGKIVVQKERLSYFINYYQPWMTRRRFVGLLLLMIALSAAFDYLLYSKIDLYNYILLLLILFSGFYVAIFWLAILDRVSSNKTDFWLNFFRLERELSQHFSLGLCQPLFAFTYIIRALLMLFIYPENGILFFHSTSGLIGVILLIIAAIAHYT